MNFVYLIVVAVVLSVKCIAQDTNTFATIKGEVRSAWANGELNNAINLLENSKNHYHEDSDQHTIIYYLGLLYLEIGDFTRSSNILMTGFNQEFFFSFWPSHIKQIVQHEGATTVIDYNELNRANYLKNATTKYDILFPEKYDPKSKYAVLYFLHGNNSNLQYLQEKWKGLELKTDIIVVLAQSPYARSNYDFDWIDSISSNVHIRKLHNTLSGSLPIDSTVILLGGFSNGGRMAIDMFIKQTINAVGFVAFNPSIPKVEFALIKESGRGAIITGEKDYLLSKQVAFANSLLELSFSLKLVISKDQNHDYPEDFQNLLNGSIEFVLMGN